MTATTISNIDLGSLYVEQPVNRAALDLYEKTQLARRLTAEVSDYWNELDGEVQQQAIELAYRIAEPPVGLKSLLNQFALRVALAGIALIDPDGARPFYAYIEATEEFADTVLHKIEQTDAGLQAELTCAISEVVENGKSLQAINLNDVDGWLNALSSEAHSEV